LNIRILLLLLLIICFCSLGIYLQIIKEDRVFVDNKKLTPIEIIKSVNPKLKNFEFYTRGFRTRKFKDGRLNFYIFAEHSWKLSKLDIIYLSNFKIIEVYEDNKCRITSGKTMEYKIKTGDFTFKGKYNSRICDYSKDLFN
jgi:hypothetical protein